jgi:hypothetical protein
MIIQLSVSGKQGPCLLKDSVLNHFIKVKFMVQIKSVGPSEIKKKIIDNKIRRKLLSIVEKEEQVIVHCSIKSLSGNKLIRIWKSTFLCPKNSGRKSTLLHVENISLYPYWKKLKNGQTVNFLLIFSGLPTDCQSFDLIEDGFDTWAFVKKNIVRNKADVYRIKFLF